MEVTTIDIIDAIDLNDTNIKYNDMINIYGFNTI